MEGDDLLQKQLENLELWGFLKQMDKIRLSSQIRQMQTIPFSQIVVDAVVLELLKAIILASKRCA